MTDLPLPPASSSLSTPVSNASRGRDPSNWLAVCGYLLLMLALPLLVLAGLGVSLRHEVIASAAVVIVLTALTCCAGVALLAKSHKMWCNNTHNPSVGLFHIANFAIAFGVLITAIYGAAIMHGGAAFVGVPIGRAHRRHPVPGRIYAAEENASPHLKRERCEQTRLLAMIALLGSRVLYRGRNSPGRIRCNALYP
jgi:hypothetical protein